MLQGTTAGGLVEAAQSPSSTISSSTPMSEARVQYSTLLAKPPPQVVLQTPGLERHLVVRSGRANLRYIQEFLNDGYRRTIDRSKG